jgi:type IV pilus assembly protein PilE
MRARSGGMTLIELLVVVVIIAIVASFAVPAYRNYVIRANRSDAKASTLAMASHLERCYIRFNAYDDANCSVDISNVRSNEGHYLVSAAVDASTFTITATPQGTQVVDPCGSFSLTSSDIKTVGGSEPAVRCWAR